MAGLMAAVTIMMIFSMIAFQEWSALLRHENEAEMMFRAQDLVRAIQRYRRDHGGQGPRKLEELMEPGPKAQYYLRHLWTDPLVLDGKWGLLFMGPGGSIVDPSVQPQQGQETGVSINPLGSSAAGQVAGQATPENAGRIGGVGNPGNGPQEGLPIAGVKSLATDHPFRVYKGLTEYSQWLFTYLDLEQQQVGGGPGQPGGPQGRPGAAGRQGPGGRTGAGGRQRPGQTPGGFSQGEGERRQPVPGSGVTVKDRDPNRNP